MTKAYVVEVDTKDGTRYLGRGRSLAARPVFFTTSTPIVQAALTGAFRDGVSDLSERSIVITISDLEKGLRASSAVRESLTEFITKCASKKKPKKDTSRLMYKIQYRENAYKQTWSFAGPGKLGKIWQREQDVRAFIDRNFDLLNGIFLNEVYVIVLKVDDDGYTTNRIDRIPALKFYEQNPKCARRVHDMSQQSLSEFPDWDPRSKYG